MIQSSFRVKLHLFMQVDQSVWRNFKNYLGQKDQLLTTLGGRKSRTRTRTRKYRLANLDVEYYCCKKPLHLKGSHLNTFLNVKLVNLSFKKFQEKQKNTIEQPWYGCWMPTWKSVSETVPSEVRRSQKDRRMVPHPCLLLGN